MSAGNHRLEDDAAAQATHAAPPARWIRTVLNVDQTPSQLTAVAPRPPMETTGASPNGPQPAAGCGDGANSDNTFLFSPPDPMLRVTKSKFSCIRHCCPVDAVFFSKEKEFDVWHDVLKTATKELWDGANVSLMLHGPASNMSLFALPAPPTATTLTAEEQHQAAQPSASLRTTSGRVGGGERPVPSPAAGGPHQNSPVLQPPGSPMRTHHHSALENILRALLKEVRHREVPRHYTAHVAVGACLMHADGTTEDITPTPPPPVATAHDAAVLEAAALVASKSVVGPNRRGNRGTSPPKDSAATTTTRSHRSNANVAAGSRSGSGLRGSNPNSPAPTSRPNHLVDVGAGGGGQAGEDVVGGNDGTAAMRMFPIPNEAAVETFAAHISPVCSLHMTTSAAHQQPAPPPPAAPLTLAETAAPTTAVTVTTPEGGSQRKGRRDDEAAKNTSPLLSGSNGGGGVRFEDECGPLVSTFSVASPTSSSTTGPFGTADGNAAEDADGAPDDQHSGGGAVLLLSVQLHQECSISKPRTSYIRIMQLMRDPTVVEDVLLAVSRDKPLPVFAPAVARTMMERIREATQIVFVQSAVPATALEVLPALAAAKGTVVRTELAAVADDIVRASEAFLNTRQRLKETLKTFQEELKGLHHAYAGKERTLSRAASLGTDFSAATLAPPLTGGAGNHGTHTAGSSRVASLQTSPKDANIAPPAVVLPKEALEYLTAHGKLPSAATLGLLSDMSLKSEDDVYAAEEAVLSFKEQSQVEKQDVELLIETNQKELGLHGDRVLSVRKLCDDLKKRLETDRYEHSMGMLDLRKTLELDLAALLHHHRHDAGVTNHRPINSPVAAGGALPQRGENAVTIGSPDVDDAEGCDRPHHRHQSGTTISMVRALRSGGGAASQGGTGSNGNNRSSSLLKQSNKKGAPLTTPSNRTTGQGHTHSTATTAEGVHARRGKGTSLQQPQQQQERTLEQLVWDLQRQRDDKCRTLEKATAALNKKRRSQEQLTELCETHVLALRDYCEALHTVFDRHVQRAARASHSIDEDALGHVPSYDEVRYIDKKLIRSAAAAGGATGSHP